MLMYVVILSSFGIFFVNCKVKNLIEPVYQTFSEYDFNKTRMFSSMSPYAMEEECKPSRAWLLSRHGKKFPSEDILSDVKNDLIPKVQAKIIEVYGDDNILNSLQKNQKMIIEALKKWENVMSNGTHKDLNHHGKLFMMKLGQRLNEKLKPLISQLNKDNIEVVSAEEERCVVSGRKFLSTFFKGDRDEINVPNDVDPRLKLVKPPESVVEIPDPDRPGKTILVEDYYYKKNCSDTVKRIQKLLFPDHIEDYETHREIITDKMVKTIYYACTHGYYYTDEKGHHTDAWCLLFSFKDLQMFENMHDLQYYYKNGYHLDNNVKLGNPLMADLLQFLENPGDKKFKLFVGHTSNCLSLITRFNLFRDDVKLTVENIANMEHRKWRTSFISPFGCNILVVVYDCGYVTHKVSIYVNEVPITMVMHNGSHCVKCSIHDVINLIKSYNTSERLMSEISPEDSEKKRRAKLLKQEERKLQIKAEKEEQYRKELLDRIQRVFDDYEIYTDKNNKIVETAASSSHSTD